MSFSLKFIADLNSSTLQTNPDEKPKYRRYWPVPPIINSVYEYQNVNTDVNLRKDVTNFFHKKIIKWIQSYPDFAEHKDKLEFIKSTDGKMHIYHLLRKFIHKTGINWYDLRDNYSVVKKYLNMKI